jgi:hypothetical protein
MNRCFPESQTFGTATINEMEEVINRDLARDRERNDERVAGDS